MPFDARLLIRLRRRAGAALRASAVPSPCSNVCRVDAESGWCEGCMRTLDEIAGWSSCSEDDKREVWRALTARVDAVCTASRSDAATLPGEDAALQCEEEKDDGSGR